MFGKDFTDPMTLLTALGITVVSPVVEEVSNGGYIGEILQSPFMVFQWSKPHQLQ
jgi:hypothetical protein